MIALEWIWLLGWPFAFSCALGTSEYWRRRYRGLQRVRAQERETLRQVHVLIQREVSVGESWVSAVPPKDFRN